MALSLVPIGFFHDPPLSTRPLTLTAAERALALDPGLVDAHVALAAVTVVHDWDWEGGERAWKHIIERWPSNADAHHWYGYLLSALGRHPQSLEQREQALALDPLSSSYNTSFADTLTILGRLDEAITRHRRTLDLDPGFFRARLGIAAVHLARGDMPGLLTELEAAIGLEPDNPLVLAWLGHAYGRAGRHAEARAVLRRLQGRTGYLSPVIPAQVHAGLGDRDAAIHALEAAFRERSPMLVSVMVDPPLRAAPRRPAVRRPPAPDEASGVRA